MGRRQRDRVHIWEPVTPLTAQLTDLDMNDVTDRLAKVRKKYNQILLELFAQSSVKIAGFLKDEKNIDFYK